MKMVMLVVDAAHKEELEVVLERAGVTGYTELAPATGVGTTGPRLGSRAFPDRSAVVFTLVDDAHLEPLVSTVRSFCEDCTERAKMIAWDVEEML
ncbi:MAG: hypothetical protein F9K16_10555 [Thermoanaerobaculia bacterium]|jgi:uncharacterized protein YaaQ|nr:MAG: hypothetical protein F9K16_10555 [Thermoanaerobaculia bacterium]MBZ0103848.1 hypothetical protein [Thermoanaerobaculia bacterium]